MVQCPPGMVASNGKVGRNVPECGEEVRSALRSDRIVRVPDQASIAATNDGAAAVVITWDFDGETIGFRADAVGDGSLAGRASLGVKITADGGRPLTSLTNGGGETYVPFSQICGPDGLAPFRRSFKSGDVWKVAFHNYSTGTAYVPGLAFHCREF